MCNASSWPSRERPTGSRPCSIDLIAEARERELVEPLPPRCIGDVECRLCRARGGDGSLAVHRTGGDELPFARHRKHGAPPYVRDRASRSVEWLEPLLDGSIRSGFSMTEPDVASSDARNISTSIVRDGDEYVINGRKWWTTGAADPRCKLLIVMGKTHPSAPANQQHSMILGAAAHPRRHRQTHAPALWLLGSAGPLRNQLRKCSRSSYEPSRGRRGRLRACSGTARTRTSSPQYARSRYVRASPRDGCPPRHFAGSVRRQAVRSRRDSGAVRRVEDGDRSGPPAGAKDGLAHRPRRDQGCSHRDRRDQGRGAQGRDCRPRSGYPDARSAQDSATIVPLAHMWARARSLRIVDGPDEVHVRAVARRELDKYR